MRKNLAETAEELEKGTNVTLMHPIHKPAAGDWAKYRLGKISHERVFNNTVFDMCKVCSIHGQL